MIKKFTLFNLYNLISKKLYKFNSHHSIHAMSCFKKIINYKNYSQFAVSFKIKFEFHYQSSDLGAVFPHFKCILAAEHREKRCRLHRSNDCSKEGTVA